jgi:hypothetical protein
MYLANTSLCVPDVQLLGYTPMFFTIITDGGTLTGTPEQDIAFIQFLIRDMGANPNHKTKVCAFRFRSVVPLTLRCRQRCAVGPQASNDNTSTLVTITTVGNTSTPKNQCPSTRMATHWQETD